MLRNSSMMHEKANRQEYQMLMRTKLGRQVMRALMERVRKMQTSEDGDIQSQLSSMVMTTPGVDF